MRDFLHWLAGRRRPDHIYPSEMSWRLFWRVSLCVVLHGDDDSDRRPSDHHEAWLVLRGYGMANGRWLRPGSIVFVRAGRANVLQLCSPTTYEARLFDLPWMEQSEIRYNTEARLWLLTLS